MPKKWDSRLLDRQSLLIFTLCETVYYLQFLKRYCLVCLLSLMHVACRSNVAVVACPSYILHQKVLKDKNILDNYEYVLANLSGYGSLHTGQLNAKHASRFLFNFRSRPT